MNLNHIVFIQIANSICRKAVRVVLASKMNYPVSCNPMKDIMVSFDCTWIKRGYKSKYGIAFVIEYTGLVIDFEILSQYCHVSYNIIIINNFVNI